ncbi:MAG: alpha-L-fucosidase [Kiritimatiellae bacterium]|nr:alpha-L-fucosidase [Kiritimatiellia bacterium]
MKRSKRVPLNYLRRHRRLLLDMHIGDWDPRALSQYDPKVAVDLWRQAGVNAAMFYCQSHVGLCYWPTRVGKMHAGLRGRDIVGETLDLLHARDMAACGYYSLIFNNWAFLEHPEWRMVGADIAGEPDLEAAFRKTTGRYGNCCPNHPEYRRFCQAQIAELMEAYSFDAFFYDMTFWPKRCLCPECRRRFREEGGGEIPETVNWLDSRWCAFQAARERWLSEFAGLMTQAVKAVQPDIPVYHNFATAPADWSLAVPLGISEHYDFLGADLYGSPEETAFVGKLFQNLTAHRPLEIMTSRCETCFEHERTKSLEEMRMSVYATMLESGAMLFIDAVNPEGTLTPASYERLRVLYEEVAPYEAWLGGEPVEEIGIYFSSESRMSFQTNGKSLGEASGGEYPHARSVHGICRVLEQAHLPYGVITRRQLPDLRRYKLLILADVLRMDREEAEAFRCYVKDGGKLLATRYTSLTETNGRRGDDFLLADVFGCHFADDDIMQPAYLKFTDQTLLHCIAPQRYLSHRAPSGSGMLRLREKCEGKPLAFLVRSFANEGGTVFDNKWISIHTFPPWEETGVPMMVRNRYGHGECVYCAADIEVVNNEANERLLLHLLADLSKDRPVWRADAHPCVRMSVFHQPELARYRVSLLNAQNRLPAIPVGQVTFRLRPPDGSRFVKLMRIPDSQSVPFETEADGTIVVVVRSLGLFDMFVAEYR